VSVCVLVSGELFYQFNAYQLASDYDVPKITVMI